MKSKNGFTIVELLIVIVVVAILASLSVAAYGGIQKRARDVKIEHDMVQIEKAIKLARLNEGGVPLKELTGSIGTAANCVEEPDGTDLAALPRTHLCWGDYNATMQIISDASGMDVTEMVDPWGRPYMIDENESEGDTYCGWKDRISVYTQPYVTTWLANNNSEYIRHVPFVLPGC